MDEDSDAFYQDDDGSDEDDGLMLDEDDGDDGFGVVGDDAFSQDPSGKGKQKSHEVEYTCHTLQGLRQQQQVEVAHIAGMFEVKVSPG